MPPEWCPLALLVVGRKLHSAGYLKLLLSFPRLGVFITTAARIKDDSLRNSQRGASMDQLLVTFVEATDEEQADRYLANLIDEQAVPIVKEILSSSLRFHFNNSGAASTQDASDLFNDIIANLLARLRYIRSV